MLKLPLTQGLFTMVDDDDFHELVLNRWYPVHLKYTSYVRRPIPTADGKQASIFMHRVILNLMPGDKRVVDHIDKNGLNNQRSNLRVCSPSENQACSKNQSQPSKASKFRGVHWHKQNEKWVGRISFQKKPIHLGYFYSEVEAAKAYDDAARRYYGEFAAYNFK